MSRYESDDEQVEAIKNWWNKNGTQLLSGLLVVAVAWSGWTYYQTNKMNQAMNASTTFEMLQSAMQQDKFSEVAREGLKLIEEQPESPYAVGIALMEAKYHYEKGEVDQAIAQLNWVVAHAPDASLKLVAQLRLVYISIDQKAYDQAQSTLASINQASLKSAEQANVAFAEAQLALAQADLAKARKSLEALVDNTQADANLLNLAQLQLDDLAE